MEPDNWCRDPAVLQMRKVFVEMARIQKSVLDHAGISFLDARLRLVREAARNHFEKVSTAAGRETRLNADTMVALYTGCLCKALQTAGIELPPNLLSDNQRLLRPFEEDSR